MTSAPNAMPELAFYYPNPVWASGDWIKNLILFFDGIALLVPEYMSESPYLNDPAIAVGLKEHGLLTILEPETFIDENAAETLSTAVISIIDSGALDALAEKKTAFHELSRSRLGYMARQDLAELMFHKLEQRGLAELSKDSFSVPVHPLVRSLVLVLLSQILRPAGENRGLNLQPATDRPEIQRALEDLLALPTMPSAGHVVSLDLQAVGVDLSAVPLDEVLDYRKEHKIEYSQYALDLRQFMRELSPLDLKEQQSALRDRQEQLRLRAAELQNKAKKAWKRKAGFALGLAGAVWQFHLGDIIGGFTRWCRRISCEAERRNPRWSVLISFSSESVALLKNVQDAPPMSEPMNEKQFQRVRRLGAAWVKAYGEGLAKNGGDEGPWERHFAALLGGMRDTIGTAFGEDRQFRLERASQVMLRYMAMRRNFSCR